MNGAFNQMGEFEGYRPGDPNAEPKPIPPSQPWSRFHIDPKNLPSIPNAFSDDEVTNDYSEWAWGQENASLAKAYSVGGQILDKSEWKELNINTSVYAWGNAPAPANWDGTLGTGQFQMIDHDINVIDRSKDYWAYTYSQMKLFEPAN